MLNIVIPMAGAGKRFAKANYKNPKPLIPIYGIPMIRLVIDNLKPARAHRFIFICQQEHLDAYKLPEKLKEWTSDCEIIGIDGVTEGAACTVLKAESFIDNDDELMIANSDQYIDFNINEYLDYFQRRDFDGIVMTMKANDPKWSFVNLDSNDNIISIIEKKVVSEEATVGIYNYSKGRDFVRSAKNMVDKGLRVNGEFYVAPVYNQLISQNRYRVGFYNIGEVRNKMYGLGTPDDLEFFLQTAVCEKAVSGKI